MAKERFNITLLSAFNNRRSLGEATKAPTDPDDPAPDLTLIVAANLAYNEHPRKLWREYSYEQQAMYISNATFLIVNILRWTREYGYN
jgi:hypothetical protein